LNARSPGSTGLSVTVENGPGTARRASVTSRHDRDDVSNIRSGRLGATMEEDGKDGK
jgi:hypothetical protein